MTEEECGEIVRNILDVAEQHNGGARITGLLLGCALFEFVSRMQIGCGRYDQQDVRTIINGMLDAFLEENWEGFTTGKHSEIH